MWPKIYFWLTWMQNINHPIVYHRLPSHLQSCYWENINWPTHLYNWFQKIQLSGIQFSQNRQPHTYIACQIYKQIFNMSSDPISHCSNISDIVWYILYGFCCKKCYLLSDYVMWLIQTQTPYKRCHLWHHISSSFFYLPVIDDWLVSNAFLHHLFGHIPHLQQPWHAQPQKNLSTPSCMCIDYSR